MNEEKTTHLLNKDCEWKAVERRQSGDGISGGIANTQRMKVTGGWLVKTISIDMTKNETIAMCFLPDAAHAWGKSKQTPVERVIQHNTYTEQTKSDVTEITDIEAEPVSKSSDTRIEKI